MRLEVVTPLRVALARPARRIVAEAPEGFFGLLPNHVDFVSALAAGVLTYEDETRVERFVAVDGGVLVKCGAHVAVATRAAITGDDLAVLRSRVESEFHRRAEKDKAARAALARLEAGVIRRFLDFELAVG